MIVTKRAAYFTNSFAPELYEVPLDPRGDVTGTARTIPLSGDFQFIPGAFNANGIESVDRRTPDQDQTIAVDGLAARVDRRDTLYAVVGGLSQITELRLSPDLGSALVTDVISDSDFDVPMTAARHGGYLYAVNAKFGTPATPGTPYEVVRVRR